MKPFNTLLLFHFDSSTGAAERFVHCAMLNKYTVHTLSPVRTVISKLKVRLGKERKRKRKREMQGRTRQAVPS